MSQFGKGHPAIKEDPKHSVFRVDQPSRRAKPLHEISFNHDCRWPLFDYFGPGALYCGRAVVNGTPYCPKHYRRAYVPVPPRRKP